MNAEQAKKLREPFPASVIGKLPKGGVTLDYVGHAATTDRLLQVDPEWTWEPLALTAEGLPALDRAGNLWIRLTVCGVTRLGVGDGKNAKECIGDAIRNAAMRFGVALDLWAKEDLHDLHAGASEGETSAASPPGNPPAAAPVGDGEPSPSETSAFQAPAPKFKPVTDKALNTRVGKLLSAGAITREHLWRKLTGACPPDPHWSTLRDTLTPEQKRQLYDQLGRLEQNLAKRAAA